MSFTLAEVLITLVVIGIIAAITVPVVMANHKKTETSAKLKKFYANMSNAVKLAETEWGVDTLALGVGCASTRGQKQWFEEHLAKYISYTKADYIDSSNDYYNELAKGMYDEFQVYNYGELFVVYLNDGSLYFNDECSDSIVYDVNGEKGPNQYGRDLFYFFILTGVDAAWQMLKLPHFNTISFSRLLQNGYEETYSREERKQNCINKSSMAGCSALLEMDGWEFKDDYPWKL